MGEVKSARDVCLAIIKAIHEQHDRDRDVATILVSAHVLNCIAFELAGQRPSTVVPRRFCGSELQLVEWTEPEWWTLVLAPLK